MDLSKEIVTWPKRFKPVPKPFCVVHIDDHFMVCTVNEKFELIDEVSVIHWNRFIVRRWAFDFASRPQ